LILFKEQRMSTVTPSELLNLWKQEQLTIEMAIGHILQNLVKQQTLLETLLAVQNKRNLDTNNLGVTNTKVDDPSKLKLR